MTSSDFRLRFGASVSTAFQTISLNYGDGNWFWLLGNACLGTKDCGSPLHCE